MTEANGSAPEKKKQTAEEIQAEIERTRSELTSTVGELSYKLDPKRQVEAAKAGAKDAVGGVKDKATGFAKGVQDGDSGALAVAGVAAAVVGVFVIAAIRGKKG
ncbi:MAG: DUF3618 domain-containing protein [Actinomycetaceae bacterium]